MHRESIFAADVWIRVEHIVPAKACKSIEVSLLELTYLVLCLQILLCFYGHHSDMTLFGNVSCGVNTKASSTKSWTASLATTPRTSFLDVTQMTPAHRVVWKVLARAGHWNLQYRSIWFIMNVKFQLTPQKNGEESTWHLNCSTFEDILLMTPLNTSDRAKIFPTKKGTAIRWVKSLRRRDKTWSVVQLFKLRCQTQVRCCCEMLGIWNPLGAWFSGIEIIAWNHLESTSTTAWHFRLLQVVKIFVFVRFCLYSVLCILYITISISLCAY